MTDLEKKLMLQQISNNLRSLKRRSPEEYQQTIDAANRDKDNKEFAALVLEAAKEIDK